MVVLHEGIRDPRRLRQDTLIVTLEEEAPAVAVYLWLEHEQAGNFGPNDVHTAPDELAKGSYTRDLRSLEMASRSVRAGRAMDEAAILRRLENALVEDAEEVLPITIPE